MTNLATITQLLGTSFLALYPAGQVTYYELNDKDNNTIYPLLEIVLTQEQRPDIALVNLNTYKYQLNFFIPTSNDPFSISSLDEKISYNIQLRKMILDWYNNIRTLGLGVGTLQSIITDKFDVAINGLIGDLSSKYIWLSFTFDLSIYESV